MDLASFLCVYMIYSFTVWIEKFIPYCILRFLMTIHMFAYSIFLVLPSKSSDHLKGFREWKRETNSCQRSLFNGNLTTSSRPFLKGRADALTRRRKVGKRPNDEGMENPPPSCILTFRVALSCPLGATTFDTHYSVSFSFSDATLSQSLQPSSFQVSLILAFLLKAPVSSHHLLLFTGKISSVHSIYSVCSICHLR
jgi:hypothetical protein